MHKHIILILLLPFFALAQQAPPDTLIKTIELDEVVVLNKSENQATLNYYQTSRQNGIEEIIGRMPGLSLVRRGNYAPEVMLHGLRNEQVGVTIDGMQIFGACTDRMDPVTSYVETNNLEQVNQGNCNSANSCHSANIAGGLDMQLKSPYFNGGTHGYVGIGYASNGKGLNTLVNLNTGHKKFAANINAIYRKQNNYVDGNGNEVNYSQFEKFNIAANFSYRVQDNQRLRLSVIIDDAYNVGYAALPMDVAFAKARIIGLTQTWFLKNWLNEINLKAYFNSIDHAMDDSRRPDVPIRMDMPGYSNTWGGFIDAKSDESKVHQFYGKAEVFSNFRHAEMTMYPPNSTEPPMFMLTWPDVRKTSALAYMQYHVGHGQKWQGTLKARLQLDFNQITTEEGESYLIPFGYEGPSTFILPFVEGNISYQINQKNRLSLTAGYTTRGPSTSEQYAFYLFNAYDGFDYIGDPNISPEKAYTASLGYSYKLKRWSFDSKIYTYHINNYMLGITQPDIDAMTIGANGVRVYDNIPFSTISGIDFLVDGMFTNWLGIIAKVSYVQGRLSDETHMPLMPPLNSTVGIKGFFGTWQVLLETEAAAAQDNINALYGDVATPAYVTNNLRVLKSFNMKQTALNLEFGVDNALDVAYRNHLDWGGILRPGRNFYIQLKYGF